MITEKQLNNFKGMKAWKQLFNIKGQLMTIFNELYDMKIDDGVDTQDAKDEIIRALNSVRDLMEGMED
jgi:hypothetical protein